MKYATTESPADPLSAQRLLTSMKQVGLRTLRVVVYWNPDEPATIQERPFLDRSLPVIIASGIDVVFSVYAGVPDDPATTELDGKPLPLAFTVDTSARVQSFARYLRLLARTYPQVKKFVVLNEPNEGYFFAPQYQGTRNVSARSCIPTAGCGLRRAEVGRSGNHRGRSRNLQRRQRQHVDGACAVLDCARRRVQAERPHAADHGSPRLPPPRAGLTHFRATTSYRWPNVGPADHSRIKQAFWDAFAGTGQPTYAEGPVAKRLRGATAEAATTMDLYEVGMQVQIDPAHASLYTGAENVAVTDPETQAAVYSSLITRFACDPGVSALFFFLLFDQEDLDRFQSGFFYPDGTTRTNVTGVRAAIRRVASCSPPRAWRHTTRVIGAAASGPTEGDLPASRRSSVSPRRRRRRRSPMRASSGREPDCERSAGRRRRCARERRARRPWNRGAEAAAVHDEARQGQLRPAPRAVRGASSWVVRDRSPAARHDEPAPRQRVLSVRFQAGIAFANAGPSSSARSARARCADCGRQRARCLRARTRQCHDHRRPVRDDQLDGRDLHVRGEPCFGDDVRVSARRRQLPRL